MKPTLLFLLFTLTFVFSAQAQNTRSYDLNKDGINDRFEYLDANKVIRIEEDRNGDKKIDFKTILNDKTYYKIEWQDTKSTGKFDRKKSFELLPDHKTRVTIELDNNNDGKFETRYEEVLENLQKQAACGPTVNQKIKDLSESVLTAVSKTDKGLLPTGLGYKVDYECYQKWGDDFNQIVKDVSLGGLQCLKDLDAKGRSESDITGALRNAFNLTQLMKDDGISLVCSEEKDYDWSATMAHASTTPDDKMVSKNISHPFVSINPSHPEMPAGNREEEVAELKNTIFHETLHNLGFKHKEDIEYPYTCGQCCFDDNANAIVKAQACKICLGNYSNETDINYVKDFVEYSQLSYDSDRGSASVQKLLKENPKSVQGISILAYAESGIFNPVGSELAKIIAEKNKVLTAENKKYLNDAQKYADTEDLKSVKVSGRVLADSLYELYYNKNGVSAVANLEKNKKLIKQELDALKTAGGNKAYIHDDLRRVLDNMVYDMWVNKYPGDASPNHSTSDKSYELFDFFSASPSLESNQSP
jgi:hypothetical protein